MAPREATAHDESNNGEAQYDFTPIERYDASEIEPDAPVGAWEFVVCPNETVKKATNPKDDDPTRRPMLIVKLMLKRAFEEENKTHEGTKLDYLIIAYGPDKVKAGNIQKLELQKFCKAIGVDIGEFPHGEALNSGSFEVFEPFIEAIDGREGKCWTYHSIDALTSEVRTKIAFTPPRSKLGASANGNGASGKPASRNGAAPAAASRGASRKPAAKAASARR